MFSGFGKKTTVPYSHGIMFEMKNSVNQNGKEQ